MDIVVEGAGAPGEGLFIVWRLCEDWKDLVVEDAGSDGAVGPTDPSILTMREFFVFRSRDDWQVWLDACGVPGTPEAADTMIHVLLDDLSTTMVTSPSGSRTHALGCMMKEAIVSRREKVRSVNVDGG
jgi:hypothetical protein